MSLARQVAIIIIFAAFTSQAAPKLTLIQDTIYKADGTRFNGSAIISWMPFDTSDNSTIGLQSLTLQIVNGAVHVQLAPNTDAIPVNYYTVQYSSDGKQQYNETWAVPPSTTPVHIKDVRVASSSGSTGGGVVQPPNQTPIPESNVTGLLTDLSLRPVRGPGYTTSRSAMVNDSGAIDSVEGNLSDCVRVDGSSGPCFDPTQVPSFVDYETPGGVVDGSNATFTLANTPDPVTSLSLYRNGLVQQAGLDFNIQNDGSMLFASASVPQPGDVLLASYRTGGASSTFVAQAIQSPLQSPRMQILCSGSGAGTTNPNYVSLGACVIPAKTLAIGDRVEVRFSFLHPVTTHGFNFLVRWGRTTMVQRTASTHDSVVTGHGDATAGTAGTSLDMQTWGTALLFDSRVAAASDALDADINVDFQAALSAAGTDTVWLQNYTILRYPAQ
jgi:hypothetical protein